MKLANLGVTLVSLLFGLIACEAALWVLEPTDRGKLVTTRTTKNGTYRVLISNASARRAGGEITVNSAGYRGKHFPIKRPAGTMRIMIFGDSHTMGTGANDDDTYPEVVRRRLSRISATQVLNFGVGGQNLNGILAYARDSIPAYKPNLLVVTFHAGDIIAIDYIVKRGKNDQSVGFFYDMKQFLVANSRLARFLIPYGAALLRSALGSAPGGTELEKDEIAANGPRWRAAQRDILKTREFLRQHNAKMVFVLFPSMINFKHNPSKELHERLGQWLSANGFKYLDLLPHYRGRRAGALQATLLDKHPNREGYRIAGEAVAAWLQKIKAGN